MANLKIIGTSHVASQSVAEIKKAFEEFNPNVVCVELDPDRARALFSNQTSGPEISDMFKIGVTAYIFAKVGRYLQQKFGAQVGLQPGIDMKTAILEGKKCEAKLYLIDKPIRSTLSGLKKISFWEKLKLGGYFISLPLMPFFAWLPFLRKKFVKFDFSKMPADNLVEKSITDLQKKFPGFYKILVGDRNKYMIKNLKKIITMHEFSNILVVVGAGHKKEMEKLLSMH